MKALGEDYGRSGQFGIWSRDEQGLPCFDLTTDETVTPYSRLPHLMATGRLSAFCDRWGNVGLFTSDGGRGFRTITTNAHQSRSAGYAMARMADGELVSLLPGEHRINASSRYGIGYAHYEADVHMGGTVVRLTQTVVAPPDNVSHLIIHFSLRNTGSTPLSLDWIVAGDCSLSDRYHRHDAQARTTSAGMSALAGIDEGLGDFFVVGPRNWQPYELSSVAVALHAPHEIDAGQTCSVSICVGYGDADERERAYQRCSSDDGSGARVAWGRRLERIDLDGAPPWERDECLWTAGQLLSFVNYDASVDENYVNLGGYGWRGFNQREVGETAMVLAPWFPELTQSSLRWMARTQSVNGHLPPSHRYATTALTDALPEEVRSSDTELWFLLGMGVRVLESGDEDLLEQEVAFRDGPALPMWEHAVRAWRWIAERIGVGRHGLVRSWHGDWNDYLFPMGQGGEGESMMNTGMACRAGSLLARETRRRGENGFADEVEALVTALREAAGRCFVDGHFVRGYTDEGKPVGAADRVFINAQSWAVLGLCGSAEQRHTALAHALKTNATTLGLCLVNPSFPSPPPSDISSLPIPAGEGENGGVWPQAVGWFLWALAEAGLVEEGMEVWRKMTLRHHYASYPDVPFGIWNGPDCYNSHLAGPRANWTQVQLWDRRVHVPMNPAIAWQAFAYRRLSIAAAQRPSEKAKAALAGAAK